MPLGFCPEGLALFEAIDATPATPVAPEGTGTLPPATGIDWAPDVFDEIARNVFVTRGMVPDDEWCRAIAGEYRKAMADLHVEVRPEGPRPKVDATDTGLALMMLAGVENGDLPLTATVPVRGDAHGVRMRGGSWIVQAGKGELHFRMAAMGDGPRTYFEIVELVAIVLPNRQRITLNGARGWLQRYTPPQRVYDALQEGMRQSHLDGEVR